MLCEERLEVFENGFDDGKFKLRIEFFGKDARKVLLAIIRELYLPEYGPHYVYPFECAKDFWGVLMNPDEITPEDFKPSPVKFISRGVVDRLKRVLTTTNAPRDVLEVVDLESAEVHKLKKSLLAVGKNFILDERGYLFVFSRPSARELILKYLGMLDGD